MAYDYALGLAKLGHQVTVFTPFYSQQDNDVCFPDFQVVRLKPWLKIGNAGLLPQLFRQLRDFDIVNLHYPFFGGAEVVWLLKLLKKNKIKLVVNYQMDVIGKGWQKLIFTLHTKLIMPRIIAAADKVIVSSFDYAKNSNIPRLIEKYPEKFAAIPPGVNLQLFFPQEKNHDLQEKHDLQPDDQVLLFVGALDQAHYFKGIHFLIDSYKDLNLKNLKVLIVGDGGLKAEYQKHVFESGLIDSILFAGKATDAELAKYYNLADAVILPSIDKSEAFGIVLIEAMACAKPVIAANLAGVRSVFENNVSGFNFELLNKDDLAEKVRKIFADDELRKKMGQAARQQAKNYYDREKLIKELDNLYRNI